MLDFVFLWDCSALAPPCGVVAVVHCLFCCFLCDGTPSVSSRTRAAWLVLYRETGLFTRPAEVRLKSFSSKVSLSACCIMFKSASLSSMHPFTSHLSFSVTSYLAPHGNCFNKRSFVWRGFRLFHFNSSQGKRWNEDGRFLSTDAKIVFVLHFTSALFPCIKGLNIFRNVVCLRMLHEVCSLNLNWYATKIEETHCWQRSFIFITVILFMFFNHYMTKLMEKLQTGNVITVTLLICPFNL